MPDISETTGIVIRKFDYSNTSLIFHLFSGTEGMIHILARGAKSPKSSFRGRIEMFHELHCHYLKTGQSSLYTLKECTPRTRYQKSALDPDSFFLCSFIADCVCSFPWEADETSEVYDLLKSMLDAMESSDNKQHSAILLYFSCRLLSILGYIPDTTKCARSGLPLTGTVYPVFDPVPGFCHRSALTMNEQNRYSSQLDKDIFTAFEKVIEFQNIENFFSLSYPANMIKKLASVCVFFLNGLADRKMRSFELLRQTGVIDSL